MPESPHPASVTETAFECPYCGAYTTQTWYNANVSQIDEKQRIPYIPPYDVELRIRERRDIEPDVKERHIAYTKRLLTGRIFLQKEQSYANLSAENVFLSQCYNCKEIAVWVSTSLVHPPKRLGPVPNPDLPEDIKIDFEEARSILNLSPRGSSALLRLCIQKLCKHLGKSGKDLDADIAALVRDGLNPVIQQSLDIVRVIGNEAVHPGSLDLKDDTETATTLFGLVNAVADQMISHPKQVKKLYGSLPEAQRKAIEKRDAKNK